MPEPERHDEVDVDAVVGDYDGCLTCQPHASACDGPASWAARSPSGSSRRGIAERNVRRAWSERYRAT